MIKNPGSSSQKKTPIEMKTASQGMGKLSKLANRTVPASTPPTPWTPRAGPALLQWFMPWKLFLKCGFSLAKRAYSPVLQFSAHCSTAGQKSRRERRTQNCPKYTNWPGMSYWWSNPWNERPQLLGLPKAARLTDWLTDWLTDGPTVLDVGTNACHLPEKKLSSPGPQL